MHRVTSDAISRGRRLEKSIIYDFFVQMLREAAVPSLNPLSMNPALNPDACGHHLHHGLRRTYSSANARPHCPPFRELKDRSIRVDLFKSSEIRRPSKRTTVERYGSGQSSSSTIKEFRRVQGKKPLPKALTAMTTSHSSSNAEKAAEEDQEEGEFKLPLNNLQSNSTLKISQIPNYGSREKVPRKLPIPKLTAGGQVASTTIADLANDPPTDLLSGKANNSFSKEDKPMAALPEASVAEKLQESSLMPTVRPKKRPSKKTEELTAVKELQSVPSPLATDTGSHVEVDGIIKRIRYSNPENGFMVAVLQQTGGCLPPKDHPHVPARAGMRWGRKAGSSGTTVVVGSVGTVAAGQSVRFKGAWKYERKYEEYRFQAVAVSELEVTTEKDIERYLGGGTIKGLGPKTAALLVAKFGDRVISVLDGDDAERMLQKVSGIGKMKAAMIASEWKTRRWERAVLSMLQDHSVSAMAAQRLVQKYGVVTERTMRADPWSAVEGLPGWDLSMADNFARSANIEPTMPSRIRAALMDVLMANCSKGGHSFLPWDHLADVARKKLSETGWASEPDNRALEEAMADLVDRRQVILELDEGLTSGGPECDSGIPPGARCYQVDIHRAEELVCGDVVLRSLQVPGNRNPRRVTQWIQKAEAEAKLRLSAHQRQAVESAAFSPVFILTGGPGCGKTHTTRTIVKLWVAMGKKVLLCAPTGRAAQNLAETTEREAKTIHRLLEYCPANSSSRGAESGAAAMDDAVAWNKFQRNIDNQLDVQALVVDETSMLDLPLAAALLSALPRDCQVLFVGDVDQLPPVGIGQVLRDIIRSEQIPVFRLSEVFRQAQESAIVTNAHLINQGKFPKFERIFLGAGHLEANWCHSVQTDCVWLETSDYRVEDRYPIMEAVRSVMQSSLATLGLSPAADVQVLSPVHQGPLGTVAFNSMLQQVLNPAHPSKRELRKGALTFREGDRVIQLQNDYEKEVFNGDMGTITSIGEGSRVVTVEFSPTGGSKQRLVELSGSDLDHLGLAWAITIHKAQGSEYPVVVMPISSIYGRMLSRKLLYTGLSRAKRMAIVVGTRKAIQGAINAVKEDGRHSHMRHRIIEYKMNCDQEMGINDRE